MSIRISRSESRGPFKELRRVADSDENATLTANPRSDHEPDEKAPSRHHSVHHQRPAPSSGHGNQDQENKTVSLVNSHDDDTAHGYGPADATSSSPDESTANSTYARTLPFAAWGFANPYEASKGSSEESDVAQQKHNLGFPEDHPRHPAAAATIDENKHVDALRRLFEEKPRSPPPPATQIVPPVRIPTDEPDQGPLSVPEIVAQLVDARARVQSVASSEYPSEGMLSPIASASDCSARHRVHPAMVADYDISPLPLDTVGNEQELEASSGS